jgi:SH3-domain binding protein 5
LLSFLDTKTGSYLFFFQEANSTFRILLNESTRRLKLLSKKLGNCIEKARPYHEACEKARLAQIECQKAAVQYQRANEIHAAAKETVALAEQRFLSNSHEWQFDGAWQEMLNHATLKVQKKRQIWLILDVLDGNICFQVMDAEKTKAEGGTEHQNKAAIFNQAEKKVSETSSRKKTFYVQVI